MTDINIDWNNPFKGLEKKEESKFQVQVNIESKEEYIDYLLRKSQGEITEEIQELINSLSQDKIKLIVFYFKIYKNIKLDQEYYASKLNKIKAKQASLAKSEEYFKELINGVMTNNKLDNLVLDDGKISYRLSEAAWFNPERISEIDDTYKKVTIEAKGKHIELVKNLINNEKLKVTETVMKDPLKKAIKSKLYEVDKDIAKVEKKNNIQINIHSITK
jgi:hypothetical protein